MLLFRSRRAFLLYAAMLMAQIAICGCLTLSTAQATLLEGKDITTAFYFPNQSTIGFGGVPVVSTIGPGIEIAASPQGFPIASIDFSDTSISLDFTQNLVGTVAAFNGWRFYDVPGVTFTGATLMTSLPGWVVTHDAGDIWLNGSGASYFVGSTLDIKITGTVPEPAPIALLAIGLIGIGYSRYNRAYRGDCMKRKIRHA
jgi:hypothetical protein